MRELVRAGVPVVSAPLLARRGRVRDSAGLTAEQRRANLDGTFVAAAPASCARSRGRPRPRAGLVVLVDDVVTTGATLTVAARALTGVADAPVVGAVVAATPRGRRAVPADPGPGVFTVRDL